MSGSISRAASRLIDSIVQLHEDHLHSYKDAFIGQFVDHYEDSGFRVTSDIEDIDLTIFVDEESLEQVDAEKFEEELQLLVDEFLEDLGRP